MQLSFSLSTLLAGMLVTLSMQVVDAVPLTRRNSNLITLPLTRVEPSQKVHPQIRLQQHINRSVRRLARMTRGVEPSSADLQERLEKRAAAVEESAGLEKRFNRIGVPGRRHSEHLEKRYSRLGVPKRQAKGPGASLLSLKKGQKGAATAPAPDAVTQANPPDAADSLGLDIEAQDVGYLATVQMGTPPRNFLLLMDSGSADLWVGGEQCQSQDGGGCGNHQFLGAQSSSSFTDTGAAFQVTYGTGQVAGNIIADDISIANLTLPAHTFGVATTESVDFSSNQTPFDGLMGLAKSDLSEQQTATPVESLAKAGLIPAAITSYKISRLSDNKNDGEITFGALDPSKFDAQAQVTVPNVNPTGFWEVNLDAVTIDGQDTGLTGRTAILDTGTTLFVVPAADAATLHAGIAGAKSDGQGGFTVPCNTKAVVALTVGGQSFDINPVDIAFQPVNAADPNGECVSGIASGVVGGPNEWLVGDVFLKNAYFSTNVDNNTITLAKLV